MSAHDDGLPDDPEGMNLMIHALVDGELDAAAALAVERRIAADPRARRRTCPHRRLAGGGRPLAAARCQRCLSGAHRGDRHGRQASRRCRDRPPATPQG